MRGNKSYLRYIHGMVYFSMLKKEFLATTINTENIYKYTRVANECNLFLKEAINNNIRKTKERKEFLNILGEIDKNKVKNLIKTLDSLNRKLYATVIFKERKEFFTSSIKNILMSNNILELEDRINNFFKEKNINKEDYNVFNINKGYFKDESIPYTEVIGECSSYFEWIEIVRKIESENKITIFMKRKILKNTKEKDYFKRAKKYLEEDSYIEEIKEVNVKSIHLEKLNTFKDIKSIEAYFNEIRKKGICINEIFYIELIKVLKRNDILEEAINFLNRLNEYLVIENKEEILKKQSEYVEGIHKYLIYMESKEKEKKILEKLYKKYFLNSSNLNLCVNSFYITSKKEEIEWILKNSKREGCNVKIYTV